MTNELRQAVDDYEHEHTPGPWHRNITPASKYTTVFAGRNKHVAYIATKGMSEEECEGNIRLITAAPELLAATCSLVEAMTYEQTGCGMRVSESVTTARAAIAKATGGTP